MTEQEYLKTLDCLYDDDVFEREVWGFVMNGDDLSCADVENAKKYYRDMIENLIKEHFDPEPYKFEDLKPGMWVYDIIKDICVKIEELIIEEHVKGFWICNPFRTRLYPCEFEEGRFFPVTKAMQEENKK